MVVGNPSDGTEPCVQRLVTGSYLETGMRPQGLAGAGLSAFRSPRQSYSLTLWHMTYERIWQKVLGPGEVVQHEFSISKRYRMINMIVWLVIGVACIFFPPAAIPIIAFALIYFGWYLKIANAYAFTDHRVLIHTGWLSTKLISTDYSKSTAVTVHAPVLSRIGFHTGSIKIDSAGTNRDNLVLKNIEHPYEVKKKLDEMRKHH